MYYICTDLVDFPYLMIYMSIVHDSFFILILTSVSTSFIEYVSCDLVVISLYECQTWQKVIAF